MNKRNHTKAPCAAAVLALGLAGGLSAAQFTENNTYDFSQTGNNTWVNYCAPTVAADLVYHFGNAYPALVQGNSYGPGNQPGADNGATDIIGGQVGVNPSDPPGPPALSLAGRMATTRNGGTSLNNMKAGLMAYLTNNSNINWNNQELLAANFVNGAAFLNALQNDLTNGYDVLLVVAWPNGAPVGGNYSVPANYDAGIFSNSAIGHAFEMIGFDSGVGTIAVNDPANNGGAHSWVAEGQNYNVIAQPANFQFNVGGATAVAYGAIVVQAIPEPSTLLLLAGAAGLVVLRLRRRPQNSRGQPNPVRRGRIS